jgi:hypothetical protein
MGTGGHRRRMRWTAGGALRVPWHEAARLTYPASVRISEVWPWVIFGIGSTVILGAFATHGPDSPRLFFAEQTAPAEPVDRERRIREALDDEWRKWVATTSDERIDTRARAMISEFVATKSAVGGQVSDGEIRELHQAAQAIVRPIVDCENRAVRISWTLLQDQPEHRRAKLMEVYSDEIPTMAERSGGTASDEWIRAYLLQVEKRTFVDERIDSAVRSR